MNNNPLNGRSAWVGIFNSWQSVTVNLPATAAGQNIQLRWNCATDSSNTGTGTGAVGWNVDSISITDAIVATNCSPVFADLVASQSLATNSLTAGQNLIYTLTVTNLGPQAAANVTFTDTVPANTSFVSASPGYNYSPGIIFWPAGMLPVGGATNFTLTLSPAGGNIFTNVVSAVTITPEITTANNTAALVSTQAVMTLPPVIAGVAANPDGSFTLNLAGTPGSTYVLETTTNLVPVIVWLPIATNTLDASGAWQFTDPQAASFQQQFYRLELAP